MLHWSIDSMTERTQALNRQNVGYTVLGIVGIAVHYIDVTATGSLWLGIVFLAGGIAGMLAAWQDIARHYKQWISVLPAIMGGVIVIWLFRFSFMLPLGIGVVLAAIGRVVFPARRALGYSLIALGCVGAAILAYNTTSLLNTAVLVGGAIWMAGETYRRR